MSVLYWLRLCYCVCLDVAIDPGNVYFAICHQYNTQENCVNWSTLLEWAPISFPIELPTLFQCRIWCSPSALGAMTTPLVEIGGHEQYVQFVRLRLTEGSKGHMHVNSSRTKMSVRFQSVSKVPGIGRQPIVTMKTNVHVCIKALYLISHLVGWFNFSVCTFHADINM